MRVTQQTKFLPQLTLSLSFKMPVPKSTTSAATSTLRLLVAGLSLLSSFLIAPTGADCTVSEEFGDLFLKAIDALEARVETQVRGGLNDLGLGPLADTLPFSDIVDLKDDVFDKLMGIPQGEVDRSSWIDEELQNYFSNSLESLNFPAQDYELIVNCPVDESGEILSFELFFNATYQPDVSQLPANMQVLPGDMPPLDLTLDPDVIAYSLEFPLIVDLTSTYTLGETKVDLTAGLSGSVSQNLPILPNDGEVLFEGNMILTAAFGFSSIHGWDATGSYDVDISVEAGTNGVIANLGLTAHDSNMFDSAPPTVAYDFNICDVKDLVVDAINDFTLSGLLETIIDDYLDLSENEIFNSDIIAPIKDAIVSTAEGEVDNLKDEIRAKFDAVDCSGQTRRLRRYASHMIEIGQDGIQLRDLQVADDTFKALTDQFLELPYVESAVAGFFASRNEIAVNIGFLVDVDFPSNNFEDAMSTVFDKLSSAQGLFGAEGEAARITDFLNSITAKATMNLEFSFGAKVGSMSDFFTGGDSVNSPVESLFIRLKTLMVQAEANAQPLDLEIFSTATINGGAIAFSVGLGLPSPVEVSLDTSGVFQNGLSSFSETVTGRFEFEPKGHFVATLPLSVTAGGTDWNLGIIFEDDNIFEDPGINVKVDFDACKVVGTSFLHMFVISSPLITYIKF